MTPPPSARGERFAALENRAFDLLVIGGGITGCAVARDAALRGLSVALVEKGDFASGTSSRSSRLIHGGVRYLEHGQLHLVFESSAERRRLLRLAPHLVRPLAFTWPVYAGARIPRWKLGAGLWVYDMLSLFRNVARHTRLGAGDVLEREPALEPKGLRGGAGYFDAATNDARLTLANAVGAVEAGAVVVNHASVTSLRIDGGRISGAAVRDALGPRRVEVRATIVVNATGPWSDDIQRLDHDTSPAVRGSKGVHIAVPRERLGNRSAITLLSPTDGRVMFALPADGNAIVGTTDTFTSSSPDSVHASNEDVRYLLDSANAFFPAAKLAPDDVVSAWAGIRPLPATGADSPGSVSREHAITTSERGLISITGGKLTTYRVVSHDAVAAVYGALGRPIPRDPTTRLALPGGSFASLDGLRELARGATHDATLAAHLTGAYGTRWGEVWNEISRPGGDMRLAEGLPYTVGELRYSVRNEMAYTLGDLFMRRTHLAFETRDHGQSAAERATMAVAPFLDWSADDERHAIAEYAREVERVFAIG